MAFATPSPYCWIALVEVVDLQVLDTLLYLKPREKIAALRCELKTIFVQIRDRPASPANQMMMGGSVRFNAQRTVMQADFTDNSPFDERWRFLYTVAREMDGMRRRTRA